VSEIHGAARRLLSGPAEDDYTMRLLSTLFLCSTLLACLDAKRGGTPDNDAAAETTPDTTTTEVGPSETVDPCFGLSCDDNDPCTVDLCADGECVYSKVQRLDTAVAEPPECDRDTDCDDSDPSTDDVCVHREDGCGVSTWAYCEHQPRQPHGCVTGDVDCGDGDPCTRDGCDAIVGCVNAPIGEGLCDSRCTTASAIDLSALVNAAPPVLGAITTAGTAGPWTEHACASNPCHYPMGLRDANAELELLGDDTPRCVEVGDDATNVTYRCEPLLADVRYLVWGNAIASSATVDGLDFQGFCLDTRADAIVGTYAATFEVEGEPLVTFDATIEAAGAGYILSIGDVRDGGLGIHLDLAAFAAQRPRIGDSFSNEGRVPVSLMLPWVDANAETESIVLFSNGNTLVGSAGPLFHESSDDSHGALPPEQEDTLPYGRLVLERVR
jgi:hypothetical protein